MTDRPFRDEPTEVLQTALGLAAAHAQQAARFQPVQPDGELPAVADLFRAELQHREGTVTSNCPNCQHPQHLPGTECDARIDHGPSRFHTCLCLARPGAANACPPQMTCQGGTLGYADIWYLQHGHTLSSADGAISPEVLTDGPASVGLPSTAAAPSAPADRGAPGMYYCDDCDHSFTAPTDTESCICSCGTRAWREKPADIDLRTLIRRACAEADGFRFEGLEPHDYQKHADAILALLPASAYRSLLARLEADRAGHLRATVRAKEAGADEVLVAVGGTFASAFRHAAAMAVRAFEGPDAAQAYMQRTEGGEEVVPAASDLRDRIEVWPLKRVLADVRCGSSDWTWEEEWADLDRRHAGTGYLAKLEQQIRSNGITMPVLIGSDGRLWDGHHRLRIAVRLGIDYVPVEITPSAEPRRPFDAQAGLQHLADDLQPGETADDLPAPGEIYRHYKGGLYTVLAVAEDTGTGAPVVVYRDEQQHWTRPLAEFAGAVADGVRRFTLEGELARLPAPADRATLKPMFEGLARLLATSSRDWGTYRVDAWLYAVLVGWDCEQTEHDETCVHGAMEETAELHGWDADTVAKARRYRAAVRRMADEQVDRVLDERVAAAKEQPVEARQACPCGQPGCEYCDDDAEEAGDVVAYRNSDRPAVLLCREHGNGWMGLTPLTSDDLPDGGLCTECGVDVLIPQQQAGEGR